MNYPPEFPDHLKPAALLAVMKADRRFPRQNQAKKRIKQAIFELCEIACTAAEKGEWPVHFALEGIEDFLHILCVDDPANHSDVTDPAFERFADPIKSEVWASKEWIGYVERLAEVGRATKIPTKAEPHPVTMTKKDAVLKILEEKGMTRSRWATLAGVDPSVVYDYLEGTSNPRADSRKALAEVIGLEPSELFPISKTQESPKKPKNPLKNQTQTKKPPILSQRLPKQ